MPIGPKVRAFFGPHERKIADLYRAIFLDIPELVQLIKGWVSPDSILEVGSGEGCVTEQLVHAFPSASITGIDVTDRVGRLYRGDQFRVNFLKCNLEELISNSNNRYDLVLVNDVLHHVPQSKHLEFLKAVRMSCTSEGNIVIKDWIRGPTLIHYLCEFSDRYITGDQVYYAALPELRNLLVSVFGADAIMAEQTVSPWHHNRAFLLHPDLNK